ncbi:MAG TPA: family 78 glycoside hydrolase catalytic domain [Haliscomenobacter sp.]|uniref:alpha-L-rhamnosidase n=1 Tax=Haliscomenobacter sp. TaxID=2717303 RepID=UPI002B9508DE|nr:family 78 glycoside hydrolase catalytic domain [Haliscomenobacter sp.]HOY17156.1 family 78 glycoside hydrolase catalytic domain [Haliscomenobacter sp.]
MKWIALCLSLLSFAVHTHAAAPKVNVLRLKCNFKENPLGLETAHPSLSWQLGATQRNQYQTAYRILVADNEMALAKNSGNAWDSGKQKSGQSIQVEYQGKKLQSAQKYYWKVMAWDAKGKASAWSEAASWQMGLLQETDWNGASWIALEKIAETDKILPALHATKAPQKPKAALPQFRKEWTLSKKLKQATAFVSGLGHFEFFLNGQKVGKNFLDPGWTNYSQTAQYVTFDITSLLNTGKNAFGIMLGNGFYHIPNERYWKILQSYGYPTCKLKILLEYTDGTTENIVSDQSWKCTRSPITYSSIYAGEDYDATQEQKGWKLPDFDDAQWQKPLVLTEGMPALRSQQQEPLGYFEEFAPKNIVSPKPGVWVYDLAQNFSGIFTLEVHGKRGATVKISPAELLHDDGTINQSAVGSPVFFNYTLKGESLESWQPQFTYYGFRFVQIEGAVPEGQPNPDNLPVIKTLRGIHTRNAAAKIGSFSCSNPLFNDIYTLIDWSIKSNMASVLTDCPHREKLGWLEEAYLMGPSLRYNYDLATLYPKILEDMRASQLENGLIPDIAPEYVPFEGGFRDSPEWGSAGVVIPWEMYQWYGNVAVLQENYTMMKRYVDYLSTRANQHIVSHGLGDWYDYGPKPPGKAQLTSSALTATAIYYYDLTILQKVASILGKTDDEQTYKNLGVEVKKAFNDKFFDPQKMQYERGSQTAYAMPLELDLVEPQHRAGVLNSLLKEIEAKNYALTAGDIGFHYLVSALQNGGASEVIYKMNSRNDVPGYGFQLAKGATALTESWPALKNVSNNHFMLGHLMEWFFNGLGGIKPSPSVLAFKEFIIKPEMVGDLNEANVSFESMYGSMKSHWKKTATSTEMNLEIPVNTRALVYLPSKDLGKVFENGKRVGYSVERVEEERLVIKLGSGRYNFTIEH